MSVTLVCKTISSCLNFCSVPSRDPNILLFRPRAVSSPPCARNTSALDGSSRLTADEIRALLKPRSSSPSLSAALADNLLIKTKKRKSLQVFFFKQAFKLLLLEYRPTLVTLVSTFSL